MFVFHLFYLDHMLCLCMSGPAPSVYQVLCATHGIYHYLNRVLRWTPQGIESDADSRHLNIILQQLNITECKALLTPGTKEQCHAKKGDETLVAGRAFAGETFFTPMLAGVLVFMFLPLAKRCVVGGAVGFLIFAVGFHDCLCWRKGAPWRCRWFSDFCSWCS